MKNPYLIWLEGLVNATLKGLTDGFLGITGGSTAVNALSNGQLPPVGLKMVVCVALTNAGLDAARYINTHPFFPPESVNPPTK